MKLKFNKVETIELLELYYREIENANVTIKISAKKARLGYGMAEYDGCLVTIIAKGTITLLGREHPFEKELSTEEVNSMITKILEKAGMEVSSVEMDSGTKSVTEGYGMGERTVNKPYFNGFVVEAEKKLEKVR